MAYIYVNSTYVVGSLGNDIIDARSLFGMNSDNAGQVAGLGGDDTYIIFPWQFAAEAYAGGIDTVILLSGAGLGLGGYTMGTGIENLSIHEDYPVGDSPYGFTLFGNELNNVITGSNAKPGSNGADTLIGGFGADTMIGGTGRDRYIVDNVGDRIVEAALPTNLGTEDPDFIFQSFYYDTVETSVSYTLAANVEELWLLNFSAALVGTGNAEDNQIYGNEKANTLSGLAGNDYLEGGKGNDTLDGGAGDDVLFGDGGGPSEDGLTYDDILRGGAGNDRLMGAQGRDTLVGGLGNDEYFLDDDEDLEDNIVDTVDETTGGGGEDTVHTLFTSYTLPNLVENLTYLGSQNFTGTGNASNNRIAGGAGNDILTGLAGDDVLDGGAGADLLTGGTGGDTYRVQAGLDTIVERANEGNDWVLADVQLGDGGNTSNDYYVLGDNLENLYIEPVGVSGPFGYGGDAYGNNLNNIILGNQFDNRLEGRGGNDTLEGLGGNDVYVGGAGDDTFIFSNQGTFNTVLERPGEGNDTIRVGGDLWALWANVENVVQTNLNPNGSWHINGNDLANRLEGNAGNDWFEAEGGADTMIGGAGDDTYHIAQAGDTAVELAGGGTDTIRTDLSIVALAANVENLTLLPFAGAINGTGNALNNAILGNAASNRIDGGAGDDNIDGGGGNDILIGGAGNDILNGGFGADNLSGGAGNDTYYVDGEDTVQADTAGIDKIFLYGQAGLDGPPPVGWTNAGFTMAAGIENLETLTTHAWRITGNALNNEIIGNARGNLLSGEAGNDILDGRGGADTMIGGLGDDAYFVDHVADIVVESAGQGIDTIALQLGIAEYALEANVENLVLAGTADVGVAYGNGGANVMTGNSLDNEFIGGLGNDTLIGGGGDDVLDGAVDVGISGVDVLRGGTGDDIYFIDFTGTVVDVVVENAGEGADTVVLSEYDATVLPAYTLTANVENFMIDDNNTVPSRLLTINGNALDNFILGGLGSQTLTGGAGNDTLVGAGGNDSMTGGAGDDTYWVDSGDGAGAAVAVANEDRVTELANGGIDTVNLVGNVAAYTLDAQVENLVVSGGAVLFTEDLIGFNHVFTGIASGGGIFTGNALANTISISTEKSVSIVALAGDDTVARSGSQLKSDDVFSGGLGRDTLTVDINDYAGAATAAGFEVINLHQTGSDDSTWAGIGAADAGTTAMTISIFGNGDDGEEGDVTLSNLPANLLLAGSRINVVDYFDDNDLSIPMLTLDFGAAVAGDSTLNLGLSNVDVVLEVAGIETLNVFSDNGPNILNVSGVDGEQLINVSGNGSLELEDVRDEMTIGLDNFSGGYLAFIGNEEINHITVRTGTVSSSIQIDEDIEFITLHQALGSGGIPGDSVIDLLGESADTELELLVDAGATLRVDGVGAGVIDLMGVDGLLFVSTDGTAPTVLFDASDYDNAQTSYRGMILNTGFETDVFDFTGGVPRYLFINDWGTGDDDVLNGDISGASLDETFDGTGASGHPGAPFISGVEEINLRVSQGSTSELDGSNIFTAELNVSSFGGGNEGTDLWIYGLSTDRFDASGFNGGEDGVLNVSFFRQVDATGSQGNDKFFAVSFDGEDVLRGGQGNDVLWGGAGDDRFVFAHHGAANADIILDFDSGDRLDLDAAVFSALSNPDVTDNLVSGGGATAVDANDFLVFDTTTGTLYYDADASGAGAQQAIATLGAGMTLAAADIFLFT